MINYFSKCMETQTLVRREFVYTWGLKAEKIKQVTVFWLHNENVKHQNIKPANTYFETVTMFRYFGTTVSNKTCVHEEKKNRLNSGKTATNQFTNIFLLVCC
jgi:hypothetical protein